MSEPREWRVRFEELEAGYKALEERVAWLEKVAHEPVHIPLADIYGSIERIVTRLGKLERAVPSSEAEGEADATTMAACPFGCGARFAEPEIWERCPRCGGSFSFNRPLSPVQPSVEPSDSEGAEPEGKRRLPCPVCCEDLPTDTDIAVRVLRDHDMLEEADRLAHAAARPPVASAPSGEGRDPLDDDPRWEEDYEAHVRAGEGQPEGAEQERIARELLDAGGMLADVARNWPAQPLPVPTGGEQDDVRAWIRDSLEQHRDAADVLRGRHGDVHRDLVRRAEALLSALHAPVQPEQERPPRPRRKRHAVDPDFDFDEEWAATAAPSPDSEAPDFAYGDVVLLARLLRAPSVQQREPDRLAESITDDLFRNGFGEVASRLELIAADESSLGGWSRDAFTERLRLLLRAPSPRPRNE